jgi:hypothetical protein
MFENNKQIGSRRLAVLIDGDNAQPSLVEKILSEASKYGTITVRRNYGDWTTSNMGGWKDTLQTHAIQPIQQFRYTIGKNATDSAMIIDAMDLLYSGMWTHSAWYPATAITRAWPRASVKKAFL